MADEAPSLIIPIRFGVAGAAQDLQTLNAQTVQATAKAQAAMTASAQQGEKARLQAAQAAAALIAQTNRDLAAKAAASAKDSTAAAKQAADAQAKAAQDAAEKQKQAARDAFADWKRKADDQHRTAMWMWEDQQGAIDKAGGAVGRVGDSMTGLMKAQMGLHAVKTTFSAIMDSAEKASEYVRNMAKEFVSLRKSMQEVASLKGVPNTTAFTIEEAEKAAAVGLTPAERREAQAQFLNYAGTQVGGKTEAEANAAGTKLTESEGEEFANRIAVQMKASGLDPKLGMELGGSMLEQAKGKQDVSKLMKDFSETSQILQKGRVPMQQAVPELSEIMSYGISAQDAAKMYAIVSPVAKGSESTSVQAALRATQEMQNKGTGAEFGVTRDMDKMTAVESFARNIEGRRQGFMAQGMSEERADNEVQALLQNKNIAADMREARGLVRGFGGQGVRLGGFDRYRKIQADVGPSYEADKAAEYRASENGQQAQRDANQAVAEAKAGGRGVRIAELRQEAETQLTNEGRFENPTLDDMTARKAVEVIGGASVRDQLINERAIANTKKMVGHQDTIGDRMRNAAADPALTNTQTNQEILALLREQNQIMKADAQRNAQQARPPLVVPPPQRGGGARMGG
jgi:hypothetical protein